MFSSNASQVSADANYIEDVFSTYLYTGNGSTQTITNNIDLAADGGLVWVKGRSVAYDNYLVDSARGNYKRLESNSTGAEFDGSGTSNGVALTSSGFSVSANTQINNSGTTYASWTFRKQPKFFDVVTYTGDGTSNRPVAHSLASVPGCIIIKSTGTVTNWMVWHRSLSTDNLLVLNSTAAQANYATLTIHDVTSTNFQVDNYSMLNASGVQYVAYVYAHDAGGFGESGEDNVISCGSYTGNGSTNGPEINLGYEPQWVMIKRATNDTGDWKIFDTMRGIATGGTVNLLEPNTSDAEVANNDINVAATGFNVVNSNIRINASGSNYIYIAIRRGPMKVPTSGTSVFALSNDTTGVTAKSINAGFPTDMVMQAVTEGGSNYTMTRLIGSKYLTTQSTAAESTLTSPFYVKFDQQNTLSTYVSDQNNVFWNFGRAPGFMDVCCYTGTGSARTVAHNLAAVPELMIVKERNTAGGWKVYSAPTGAGQYLFLNSDAAPVADASFYTWNNTAPTSSVFSLGIAGDVNQSGATYVAYLFASCPGVSKIGTFTYPGTSTVDCGFSSGARFVMLKRTSTTGGWLVFDTARGIVSGNDPYLELQSTNAEVTTGDVIDPNSSGFAIGSNLSNGTYIFLAIA